LITGDTIPTSRSSVSDVRFAHESELRFARILDFYGVAWEYEPVEFTLAWDEEGRRTAGFRPDFWLPDQRLFVELTTLSQRLVTKKNGKVRRLAELYPDVRVTLLHQRDTLALLATYGVAGDGFDPWAEATPA
jgi:hypoxanthine phosphoribosyltransferase